MRRPREVAAGAARSTPKAWQSRAITTCLVTFRPRIPHSTPNRKNQMFKAMQAIATSKALIVKRNLDLTMTFIMVRGPRGGKEPFLCE